MNTAVNHLVDPLTNGDDLLVAGLAFVLAHPPRSGATRYRDRGIRHQFVDVEVDILVAGDQARVAVRDVDPKVDGGNQEFATEKVGVVLRLGVVARGGPGTGLVDCSIRHPVPLFGPQTSGPSFLVALPF